MDEEDKFVLEEDPTRYFEESLSEAMIAKSVAPATAAKLEKIALLNELSQLTQQRRAVIRYLVLILDLPWAANKVEFPLSRKDIILRHVATFVNNYFEDNPLSQLGIVGMNNGKAYMISDFTASIKQIVR